MSVWAGALFVLALLHLSTDTSALLNFRRVRRHVREEMPLAKTVDCSDWEFNCWEQGQLHEERSCQPPLSQGPCPQGQWFVLAGGAAAFQGRCEPLPCPADRRAPACRALSAQKARACGTRFAHFDPAGRLTCGPFPGRVPSLHRHLQCRRPASLAYELITRVGSLRCAQTDDGECGKKVVDNQPRFTLEDED